MQMVFLIFQIVNQWISKSLIKVVHKQNGKIHQDGGGILWYISFLMFHVKNSIH